MPQPIIKGPERWPLTALGPREWGPLPIFIGLNLRQAGIAFGFVVTTEGNDTSHLMVGVSSLGKAFLIQVVLASIYVAVIIFAQAAAIVIPT